MGRCFEDGYYELATAIILLAKSDYIKLHTALKHPENYTRLVFANKQKDYDTIYKFFHSNYGETVTCGYNRLIWKQIEQELGENKDDIQKSL